MKGQGCEVDLNPLLSTSVLFRVIKDIFYSMTPSYLYTVGHFCLVNTANRTPYRTGEKALTPREYEKLLEVCNTLEDEVMLKLAVELGLRRVDIANVKINDVDLRNNTISYYEHKKDRTRTVPIGPKLAQLLRKYINTLPKGQKKLLNFSDRTAHRRLQALCERAGISKRPFHALRATCIKFCQRNGWTPEQTAELVGDTLLVIQRHYSVPSFDEMKEVMEEKEVI